MADSYKELGRTVLTAASRSPHEVAMIGEKFDKLKGQEAKMVKSITSLNCNCEEQVGKGVMGIRMDGP